ncbi:MAG: iron ABC transporter permease, partial [Pseudomonadota bacterium]
GLSALCPLCLAWSLSVGAVPVPLRVVLNTVLDLSGPQQDFIILQARLPRSLLALITGGALALAGVIVQTLLRNPLASPKIIGVNSGAALAVLLAFSASTTLPLTVLPVVAGIGGVLAAACIYVLAQLPHVGHAKLILIGLAVGMTCDAVIDFLLVTADTQTVSAPLIWLTGALWGRGWPHVHTVWVALVALMLISAFLHHRLDLLRLSEAQARGVGVDIARERLALLFIATLLAAISVSVVGVLGFVGLMAPHMARALVGERHSRLIPIAVLIGALLVLITDTAGRSLFPPLEISAGILTALLGAPFFIYLLMRQTKGPMG